MPTRIPEGLREILTKEFDETELDKVIAQVFQNGAMMKCYPDGSRRLLLDFALEIQVQPPGKNTWYRIDVNTESRGWRDLISSPPDETEIAVFPGNMNRGAQGKHDQNTWEKDDLNTDNAPIRRGYGGRGHRGGMRQANRPAALKALLRRPSRKYR